MDLSESLHDGLEELPSENYLDCHSGGYSWQHVGIFLVFNAEGLEAVLASRVGMLLNILQHIGEFLPTRLILSKILKFPQLKNLGQDNGYQCVRF